jgi:hypothetical protein
MTATRTSIEIEHERASRSIATEGAPSGAIANEPNAEDAKRAALVRGLRVVADRIERGETVSEALLAAFDALQAILSPLESTRSARVVAALRRVGGEAKRIAGETRTLLANTR